MPLSYATRRIRLTGFQSIIIISSPFFKSHEKFPFSNYFSERSKLTAEITPKSASQGKTRDNGGYDYCCSAAHAIDRDLSTMSATYTDGGRGWLKLDFYRIHYIHKIVIHYRFFTHPYNPKDYCVSLDPARFGACVDADNNVDVSVYQGEVKQKSCGTLQLTYGLEQSDQIYTLLCNTEGDTVKLSKETGNIVVYEVVVLAKLGISI